jgi:lipopolysaccharide assembly protein A
MRIIRTILLVLFIVAIVIFTFQNMETVKLSFLKWHLEIPLSLASVLLYILGALSGGLLFSMLKKLSSENSDKKNH